MNNEAGRQSTLDRAIDSTVREMMRVDPRPGLSSRVLRKIRDGHTGTGGVSWAGVGALAAASLVLVLIAAAMLRGPSPEAPAATEVARGSASQDVPAAPAQEEKPPVAAPAPQEPPAAAPTPESIFGPRASQVRAASTDAPAAAAGAPGSLSPVAPLVVPPLQGTEKEAAKGAASAQTVEKPVPQRAAAQLANVRLEITITDEREAVQTTPRTVAMVVSDRQWGRIRAGGRDVILNVDANPEILADGRIRVSMTLEYRPARAETEKIAAAGISETLTAIVSDGVVLNASQSADPSTNRLVKVDVKATVLR